MKGINPLDTDLKEISSLIDQCVIDQLIGKKLFLSGGTGFFGTWLLEWINYANCYTDLDLKVTILTRNFGIFKSKAPHLTQNKSFSFFEGDLKNFPFPNEKFDFVIHAATEASDKMNIENPLGMIDSILNGTRRVLDFSLKAHVKKMLFISSGAVYGKQPSEISHLKEDCLLGPDVLNVRSAYAEGKRMAELLCSVYANNSLEISTGRCFAFVGPYLNLNIHYAIGNFIRDGLNGKAIEIKGDGTPVRSYMYMADLVIWLFTALIKGKNRQSYNIGSDRELNIREVANKVAAHFNNVEVIVNTKPLNTSQVERYVPCISKAKSELGLQLNYELDLAIEKTINYYKQHKTMYL